MNRSKLVLHILTIGIVLGIMGDTLLRVGPWAFNLTLWIATVLAVALVLVAYHRVAWPRGMVWLALPVMVFALGYTWRDSPGLKTLDLLAILVGFSIWALSLEGVRLRSWGILDYLRGMTSSGLAALAGVAVLERSDIAWPTTPRSAALRHARSAVVGLLIAFPLLFIFGGLLMAADAVFEDFVTRALDFDFATILSHAALSAFFTWIVCGYLFLILKARKPLLADSLKVDRPGLGLVEIALPLALIDLLFLTFVVVQLRYLFGDAALVQETVGLSYAEYARRGFFELVTVAALVLPLLLLADWVLLNTERRSRHIFRALAGVQLLLLFVIMISALQRMNLYVDAYGLTELRLYSSALMIWLGIVFAWFAATVLRSRREHFTLGAVASGFLAILALNFLNPDALIARVNVERARAGYEFDALYATSLSADAVPRLVAALPDLGQEDRCLAATRILERWMPPAEADWRTWNRARSKAWRAVEGATTDLSVACPAQPKTTPRRGTSPPS
ncbi:MAG: DUF4173 domain-containing protein [Gemmatimonadota bacterium]|nr:MAG: DUF4173 domain-containing protein [Gemmatimonadota bacterium]